MDAGAVIVEWPERALSLLPADRIEIVLAETADPDRRLVTVRGLGAPAARLERIAETLAFLDAQPQWAGARIAYLQGDASTRAYARLSRDGRTALLMDAPRIPTGRPSAMASPTARSRAWPRTWCARSWPSALCCARRD